MSLASVRGALYKAEKEDMKFSRTACAKQLGVTYQTYCAYERNGKLPVSKAIKLAKYLGCGLDDIFLERNNK